MGAGSAAASVVYMQGSLSSEVPSKLHHQGHGKAFFCGPGSQYGVASQLLVGPLASNIDIGEEGPYVHAYATSREPASTTNQPRFTALFSHWRREAIQTGV